MEDQFAIAVEHKAECASDQRPERGFHHRPSQPQRQRLPKQNAPKSVRKPEGAHPRILFRI